MSSRRYGNIVELWTACLVLAFSAVNAQNLNWNITGAGARAAGFSGAFIGVADDATAVSWNPAGLTQLERPEASAVVRIVMEAYDYTDSEYPEYDQSETYSHSIFNFASGALPIELAGRKMVFAIAYQQQLDLAGYNYSEDEFGTYEDIATGGANTITPGLAVQLSPLLSVGASVNIWLGSAESETVYTSTSRGYTYSNGSDFSGFNLMVGVLADLSALQSPLPLKLGVSLRTPFQLAWDYSYTNRRGDSGTNDWLVGMPLMVGFGASYRLGEFLTLAADAEFRAYSASEFINEDGQNSPMSENEEDIFQLRLGVEYLLVNNLGVFPIRVGFKSVPTLFADYDDQDNPIGQVVGAGFSLGSGYITSRFALDITYSTSWYDQSLNTFLIEYSTSVVTVSGIFYF